MTHRSTVHSLTKQYRKNNRHILRRTHSVISINMPNQKEELMAVDENTDEGKLAIARVERAIKLQPDRRSPASNREVLATKFKNKLIMVYGTVLDARHQVDTHNRDHFMLLLYKPVAATINIVNQHFQQDVDFTPIDSHIWISMEDVLCTMGVGGSETIGIGDTLALVATVKPYQGRINAHEKGTKYGLKNLTLIETGLPNKTFDDLVTNYSHYKDWVIKIHNEFPNPKQYEGVHLDYYDLYRPDDPLRIAQSVQYQPSVYGSLDRENGVTWKRFLKPFNQAEANLPLDEPIITRTLGFNSNLWRTMKPNIPPFKSKKHKF